MQTIQCKNIFGPIYAHLMDVVGAKMEYDLSQHRWALA
jgi:hypothetical protein